MREFAKAAEGELKAAEGELTAEELDRIAGGSLFDGIFDAVSRIRGTIMDALCPDPRACQH